MKRSSIIFIFLAAAIVVFLFWFYGPRLGQQNQKIATTNFLTAANNGSVVPEQQMQGHAATNGEPTISDAVKDYVKKSLADPGYDWKQPINFYGRVVDESNNPVVGANIHFTWNDTSEKGTSNADTTSDNNGAFSLNDRRGKRLYVDVGKKDYYSSGDARGATFEYANPANGLFKPDAGNPVVFHLRIKGVGVDLITSQYGMSPDFPIHIPRAGTPIKVDFLQRKTGNNGQMQITENKPEFKDWKQATNWWFRLEISDGGLIEQNDEFPFFAPDEGYQAAIEYHFQKGQPDWAENFKTNYYVKFGNPPIYGRLQIQTGISYGGAILIYAINPTGSRNLEPK